MGNKLDLNEWRFKKGEIVTLHWICSPYRDQSGRWVVYVVFINDKGTMLGSKYPWGTLPYFKIGHLYRDGLHLGPSGKKGKIIKIKIPDV